jgi:hypothetical protein
MLVTERVLAQNRTVTDRKLPNECFIMKKETIRQCAYSALATEH